MLCIADWQTLIMHKCEVSAHLLLAGYNRLHDVFAKRNSCMTAMMKAAIYKGPGDIEVQDYPMPDAPGRGELLVKVKVCGMCGSDVTDWYMTPRAPTVLGHEPAGDVIAVGEGVTSFAVGDRVGIHHHVPCMVCDFCRRGSFTSCPTFKKTRLYPAGMAEYVRIPAEIVERDILKIPDDLPYEVGALLEPVGCCVRALDRSHIQHGDTLVIVGAGFNGIVMALMAHHWGVARVAVLDRLPVRLERARGLGLQVFNVDDADMHEQIKAWTGGVGPHVVVSTASNPKALDMAFNMVAAGGTLMLYAPTEPNVTYALNTNRVLFGEVTVAGTYSASPHDTRAALALMQNGILDYNALITHRLPLAEVSKAWHMTKAAGDSLKIVVEMN
jgi:L-iditol 2-dehydrogenase